MTNSLLRLSTAIRLGATLHPQGFRRCFQYEEGAVIATCALGAAYAAIHVDQFVMDDRFVAPTEGNGPSWQQMLMRNVRCPECLEAHMASGITHLNDYHRWDRDRIADYVAALEQEWIDDQARPTLIEEDEYVAATF
jgi:hypothetical protein